MLLSLETTRPADTTVPQNALDRASTGAYAYKHDCQGVSARSTALRLREHAPGGAGHDSAVRRGAAAEQAPDHPIHIVAGPGTNRRADDPGRARRPPGARHYDAQPYAQTAGAGQMDSTRGGRRRQGAPHRACDSRSARSRARDPRVGAGTATAQDEAGSAGLGGTAGAVDGGGDGGVERLAQKIITKRYDACSTRCNLRTGAASKEGTTSARSDAMGHARALSHSPAPAPDPLPAPRLVAAGLVLLATPGGRRSLTVEYTAASAPQPAPKD